MALCFDSEIIYRYSKNYNGEHHFLRAQIDSPAGAFDDPLPECFINHISDFFLTKAGLLLQGGDIKSFF